MELGEPCFTINHHWVYMQYQDETRLGAACGGSSQGAYQPRPAHSGSACHISTS